MWLMAIDGHARPHCRWARVRSRAVCTCSLWQLPPFLMPGNSPYAPARHDRVAHASARPSPCAGGAPRSCCVTGGGCMAAPACCAAVGCQPAHEGHHRFRSCACMHCGQQCSLSFCSRGAPIGPTPQCTVRWAFCSLHTRRCATRTYMYNTTRHRCALFCLFGCRSGSGCWLKAQRRPSTW